MKRSIILLLMTLLFFTSCQLTSVEISLNDASFEGMYQADVDCDGRFEDVFERKMDVTISHIFGNSYEINLDDKERLIANREGSKLILIDQNIQMSSSNEPLKLNGEIYESGFDDLIFEFTTSFKNEEGEDCSLELERE